MFIENIEQYPDKSSMLKKMYTSKCPICHGEGLVETNNGYVSCDCVKKANIHARLLCNGMPKKFLNLDFDSVNINNDEAVNKAKEFCDNIETNIFNGTNLFITGNNKVNIMKLDCTIANNLAYKKNSNKYYYNILIVSVEELTQTIAMTRTNFELKNKLKNVVSNVDILILNYLGDESDTRTEQTGKYLTNLFVERSFNEKTTILSSTIQLDDIANKYGTQFISTLKQDFKVIKLFEEIEEKKEIDSSECEYYN